MSLLYFVKLFNIQQCCAIKGDDIDNQVYIKPRRLARLYIKIHL